MNVSLTLTYWFTPSCALMVEPVVQERRVGSIKGASVTRHGSKGDPALLIEQEDGDGVLKLASEVRKA